MYFSLISRSNFRKMCPFFGVIVCSDESTIASLTGLKNRSPYLRLLFFLKRLPPVVICFNEGRVRWAAGISVVRFPEEILARGRFASESEERSMSASWYPSSALSWGPSSSPDGPTRSISIDLNDCQRSQVFPPSISSAV